MKQIKLKIPNYLKLAMRFDKTYFDIPVVENKELLVSIKSVISKNKLKVYFSKDKTGDKNKIYVVRKGLIEPLLIVINKLNEKGLTLRFEYAYRTLAGQKNMYMEFVKRIEKERPDLDRETQLSIAGIYGAWNFATAAHVGGAAVDITLVDMNGDDIDMGVRYLESGPKTTTKSKQISKLAQKNRQLLCKIMETSGFANYPFEYWHFSMGDKVAAKIQGKKFAIYGPVDFNPIDQSVRYLSNEEQQERFEV